MQPISPTQPDIVSDGPPYTQADATKKRKICEASEEEDILAHVSCVKEHLKKLSELLGELPVHNDPASKLFRANVLGDVWGSVGAFMFEVCENKK